MINKIHDKFIIWEVTKTERISIKGSYLQALIYINSLRLGGVTDLRIKPFFKRYCEVL